MSIISQFFRFRGNFCSLSEQEKAKWSFPVNRWASRKEPVNGQLLNHSEVDPASLIDCWYLYFQNYNYQPDWLKKAMTNKTQPTGLSSGQEWLKRKTTSN